MRSPWARQLTKSAKRAQHCNAVPVASLAQALPADDVPLHCLQRRQCKCASTSAECCLAGQLRLIALLLDPSKYIPSSIICDSYLRWHVYKPACSFAFELEKDHHAAACFLLLMRGIDRTSSARHASGTASMCQGQTGREATHTTSSAVTQCAAAQVVHCILRLIA